MDFGYNFCQNLRFLRKQKGFNQSKVAKKMKMSRSTYAYIERHSGSAHLIKYLEKLCKIYKVTPNDLFCCILGENKKNQD